MVAHPRGFFKLQVAGVFHHELFQALDLAGHVFFAHVLHLGALHRVALQAVGLFAGFLAVDAVDQVAHFFDDAARRNAVLQVMGHLARAPPLGLADGARHRVGNAIGVQNSPAMQIACGPADGLDKRALAPQKAFFIRIQNRYQRDFGQVNAFAQQVDAYQHIKSAQAQIAQYFHPLHRVHVAVQVAHFHAVVAQIVSQLLGHALGQRRDQHALVFVHADADFLQHIVHLRAGRAHFHFRVHQAGGAHQLLHHLAGMVFFPLRGRG